MRVSSSSSCAICQPPPPLILPGKPGGDEWELLPAAVRGQADVVAKGTRFATGPGYGIPEYLTAARPKEGADMSESDWLACGEPDLLLEEVEGKVSPDQLVAFV